MKTTKHAAKIDWTQTDDGFAKYKAAREDAQKKANETDLFKSFHVFMLPKRVNRCGHELRCEVVSCEILEKCQPGHGLTLG